ncbi:MAG: HAD family phosphatase [Deltaproteobacteria bacterium]|nr:HAD family phosphatase [Deltaproteobacteria bacterium]MCB9789168.1 HAD family phosphatase [Deltaproteobacteria bacterium]
MPQPRYELVAFDLDGTLVAHHEPIWKTLHERLGTDPAERARVVGLGLSGAIAYADWFAHDVRMLRAAGARRDDVVAIARSLEPAPGARALVEDLRRGGARVAILSGGVDLVLDTVLGGLDFDAVHINRLHFDGAGALSGGEPTPYDRQHKAAGLRALARRFGVATGRTAFVGDGPNDVAAAEVAGLSIAWGDAPAELIAASHHHERGPHLDALRPHLFR